jgi:elongator complex protein 4
MHRALTHLTFSGDPSLAETFPSHHGLVRVHSVPAPHTFLPPSDRFSTLRGLAAGGENNLAFKCMRKRMVFETLHLDVEGGVGERRTAPSATAGAFEDGARAAASSGRVPPKAEAQVSVEVEEGTRAVAENVDVAKVTKRKKKVAFQSERPDLYDF